MSKNKPMTVPKSQEPVFDLYMDMRVSERRMRHKIGFACENQNGEGLMLSIEGVSTLIIALPVVEKPNNGIKPGITD